MSSFSHEGGRVRADVNGLDPRARELTEFAIDIVTAIPMTRPARANEEGIIERPMALGVSPAYLQVIADIALRGGQEQA